MSPAQWRLIGVLALALAFAVGAWQVHWRYGKQLADQSLSHSDTLNQLAMVAATQQQAEQDKRLALEQRLSASDQTYYKELSNAQKDQARLRDRLATSDLWLSALLDAADPASGYSVPAATEAGDVVHGGARVRLDPAHAQRIVGITDDGDRGLIALAACQAYIKNFP